MREDINGSTIDRIYVVSIPCRRLPEPERDAIRVEFDGTKSEHEWALEELKPSLPSDWSDYEFLVLEMRASSPQRFYLSFRSADLVQARRMHPWQMCGFAQPFHCGITESPTERDLIWPRSGKYPETPFGSGTGGEYGPLDSVEAIGVSMEYPFGKPTLEIRSVQLAKEDPGSDVLEPKPLVDEFGQWIPSDWPGKIRKLGTARAGVGRGRGVTGSRRLQLRKVRRLQEHPGQGNRFLPG